MAEKATTRKRVSKTTKRVVLIVVVAACASAVLLDTGLSATDSAESLCRRSSSWRRTRTRGSSRWETSTDGGATEAPSCAMGTPYGSRSLKVRLPPSLSLTGLRCCRTRVLTTESDTSHIVEGFGSNRGRQPHRVRCTPASYASLRLLRRRYDESLASPESTVSPTLPVVRASLTADP